MIPIAMAILIVVVATLNMAVVWCRGDADMDRQRRELYRLEWRVRQLERWIDDLDSDIDRGKEDTTDATAR